MSKKYIYKQNQQIKKWLNEKIRVKWKKNLKRGFQAEERINII